MHRLRDTLEYDETIYIQLLYYLLKYSKECKNLKTFIVSSQLITNYPFLIKICKVKLITFIVIVLNFFNWIRACLNCVSTQSITPLQEAAKSLHRTR